MGGLCSDSQEWGVFFFFEGNENVLKLTVLIDGQLCK